MGQFNTRIKHKLHDNIMDHTLVRNKPGACSISQSLKPSCDCILTQLQLSYQYVSISPSSKHDTSTHRRSTAARNINCTCPHLSRTHCCNLLEWHYQHMRIFADPFRHIQRGLPLIPDRNRRSRVLPKVQCLLVWRRWEAVSLCLHHWCSMTWSCNSVHKNGSTTRSCWWF